MKTKLLAILVALPFLGGSVLHAATFTFTCVTNNTGAFDVFFDRPAINNAGAVAFHASLKSGVQGIYRADGSAVTPIVDTSSGEFVFSAGPRSLESRPAIDDDGTVAFFIYHVAGSFDYRPSVCTGNGGTPVILAEASTTGIFYDALSNPCIRNGVVSFRGGLNDGADPHGVFTAPAGGGSFTAIALSGGKFSSDYLGESSINAGGQVAYYGDLTNGTSGIFVGPDGAATIAQTGSGSAFAWLDVFPKISDSGAVVFHAELADLTYGDFLGSGGSVTQITVAGGGEADGSYPSINAAGTVVGYGRLASGEKAVLAGTGSVVDKVIADGDALFGSTVVTLGEPGSHGLNNQGQIVFTYALENGVEGIAIATPANGPPATPPVLQVQRLDPFHLRLAWTTNAPGFGLESAPTLAASTWQPVTNTPALDGAQFTVELEMGGASQFFRLNKP